MESVEVVEIKRLADTGNLKGFVSVKIGSLTIHGLRIVQQQGQTAWVSLPQSEYSGKDGKKKYASIVEVPDAVKVAIQTAVLAAWQRIKNDSN